eukprot:TRINITY_DN92122_c0_g1_i1.p2 TRINITY_DN92122_c0_g1~~TRINITY_DN92122_c0_g1_i1.p2  ORF type:complete len:110 (+),score=14.48 TRINITY_DN92122_c0_g1_i1:73-402(+)
MACLACRLLLSVLTAVLQCGHTSTWTLPESDCQDDASPGTQMLQSQVRSIVHDDVSRRTGVKLHERTDKRERLQFANEVEFKRKRARARAELRMASNMLLQQVLVIRCD